MDLNLKVARVGYFHMQDEGSNKEQMQ